MLFLAQNTTSKLANHNIICSQQLFTLRNMCLAETAEIIPEENDVIFETISNSGRIILNRPKALNALNLSMANKLYATLKSWEKTVDLVVIRGRDEKAFCAGGDLHAIMQAGDIGYGQDLFRKTYMINGVIGTYAKPYVALIDGIVMGAGVGLSMHGKYRVATERTLFAMPETQIGLFPDVGGSYFLPRLKGRLGWYLALTGHRLRGSDMYLCGIATHYCESRQLDTIEQQLLKCQNEQDIEAVLGENSAPVNQEFSLKPHMDKINDYFNVDKVETLFSKLEEDGSDWAKGTLGTLRKMCPTSLKVTWKELELGANKDLLDCLQMEYRMAVKSLKHTEFYEGVRALLIDKDQKPNWNPPNLDGVNELLVKSFFTNLGISELRHRL